MKRLIVCLLTLFVCLTLVAPCVSAEEVDGVYRYEILPDGTVMLVGTTQKLTGSVILPSQLGGRNLTAIGEDAFYEFENMISLQIPHGVTEIGNFCFAYCKGLETIQLPETLTAVGEGAFMGCSSLKTLTIPASLRIMGRSALDFCTSVTAYHVGAGSTIFEERDGVLFNIETEDSPKTLLHYPAGRTATDYTLPDDTVLIGERAFNGSAFLTNLRLNDQLTWIQKEAFINCPQLKTVTMVKSIENIGEHALGFLYQEGGEHQLVPQFLMQGLDKTKAQEYATAHGITYKVLTEQQLNDLLNPPVPQPQEEQSMVDKLINFAKTYQMYLIIGGGVLFILIVLIIVSSKKKNK